MRTSLIPGLAMAIVFPATAQFAEPILIRTAIPEAPGDASLQLLFVSPVGAGISQALPQARLEIGFGQGFQAIVQMPLLRIAEPNGGSILGGGQLSAALQYLIAGSVSAGYALSFAVRVEAPSGDSAIVGNQTQIMPTALVERRARRPFVFRSDIGWDRAVPEAADDSLFWNTTMLCRGRIGQTSCLPLTLSEARILCTGLPS